MSHEVAVITDPANIKASTYRLLNHDVLDGTLHQRCGMAERRFDEKLHLGFMVPIYPNGGRGFPYVTDVALEKILSIFDIVTQRTITTDVCWLGDDGDKWSIANKPGCEHIDEAIKWWMSKLGKRIYNIGGTAFYDPDTKEIHLWTSLLEIGIINPKLETGQIAQLIQKNKNNISGGVSFFPACTEGILLSSGIKWQRHYLGSYNPKHIQPIPLINSSVHPSTLVDRGELSLDELNHLSIKGLLFGIDPHGKYIVVNS